MSESVSNATKYRSRFARSIAALALSALIIYASPNLDTDLWIAPVLCVAFCIVYFRPAVYAVILASIALGSGSEFIHGMMTTVEPGWSFEPFYFKMGAVLFTLYVVAIAIIPFIFLGLARLTRRDVIGKGYGWKAFRLDVLLALALFATVISVLYVGTHGEREVAISKLYHETLNFELTELAERAVDSSLTSDQRAAAIYAIVGYGIDRDRLSKRYDILRQIEPRIIDADSFEAFALELAIRITEGSPIDDYGSMPFFYKRIYREAAFCSFYDSFYRLHAEDEEPVNPEVSHAQVLRLSKAIIPC